ncbi:hypothetical protein U1Q18_031420 [Sarracenia purpurea var. burkii]
MSGERQAAMKRVRASIVIDDERYKESGQSDGERRSGRDRSGNGNREKRDSRGNVQGERGNLQRLEVRAVKSGTYLS